MLPCKKTTMTLNNGGYGYNGTYYEHRLVYEQTTGEKLQPGEIIMHTCDNTWCVEFTHLVKGTQKDNIRDAINKGRRAYGTKAGSPLTQEQVDEILDLLDFDNWRVIDVAKKFNVSKATISRIKNGLRWNYAKKN